MLCTGDGIEYSLPILPVNFSCIRVGGRQKIPDQVREKKDKRPELKATGQAITQDRDLVVEMRSKQGVASPYRM